MEKHSEHSYALQIEWTGNLGQGTNGYRAYARDYEISGSGKPTILGSADPAFRGNAALYNPEELLVSSLSACHMLWYLHLCADAHIVVLEYIDRALGTMVTAPDGRGRFTQVVLRPVVTIKAGGDPAVARQLHAKAHELCFIANSINFRVACEPRVLVDEELAH